MEFVVTHASSNGFYCSIKTFTSITELVDYMNKQDSSLIIEPNFWYGEPISEVQKIFPGEDVEKIVSIPNAIKVYDDYIE
jgi:hypothetical protein